MLDPYFFCDGGMGGRGQISKEQGGLGFPGEGSGEVWLGWWVAVVPVNISFRDGMGMGCFVASAAVALAAWSWYGLICPDWPFFVGWRWCGMGCT